MGGDVDYAVTENIGGVRIRVAWKGPRSTALGVVTESGRLLGASGSTASIGHAKLEVEPATLAIVLGGGRFAVPARVVKKNFVVHFEPSLVVDILLE